MQPARPARRLPVNVERLTSRLDTSSRSHAVSSSGSAAHAANKLDEKVLDERKLPNSVDPHCLPRSRPDSGDLQRQLASPFEACVSKLTLSWTCLDSSKGKVNLRQAFASRSSGASRARHRLDPRLQP